MASSSNPSKLKSFRKCCIFSSHQLQILVTFGLCVLIWLIQLLHYPSFKFYEEIRFPEAMLFHQRRISFIVIVMFLEFLWERSSQVSKLIGVKSRSLMKKHRKLSIKIIGLPIIKLLKIMLKKLSKLDAADGKLRMKEITFLKITVII